MDSIYKDIIIEVTHCNKITTYDEEEKAGFRLKIKNNSLATIYKLYITAYYFDKTDKIFYEENFLIFSSSSWSDSFILKPNYIYICPSEKNSYLVAKNIDISEWNGNIEIKIKEIQLSEDN